MTSSTTPSQYLSHTYIVAIDPGYDRCGIAILKAGKVISYGTLTSSDTMSHHDRLNQIRTLVIEYVTRLETVMNVSSNELIAAVEMPVMSIRARNAGTVQQAVGVVLSALAELGIKQIIELNPSHVKKTVACGTASKKQIKISVSAITGIEFHKNTLDDSIDAIAIGIAAHLKLAAE